MTDLELVRDALLEARNALDEHDWPAHAEDLQRALYALDGHRKEDAERERKTDEFVNIVQGKLMDQATELTELKQGPSWWHRREHELEDELAELREAVRAILDTTDSRYSREDRLRRLIEEVKP